MIICPFDQLGRYAPIIPGLQEAIDCVRNLPNLEPATYPLSCGRVTVQPETDTKPLEPNRLETHREYLDIQLVGKGREILGWAPAGAVTCAVPYNPQTDMTMNDGPVDLHEIREGCCSVLFPEDAHYSVRHVTTPTRCQKILIKLKI